MIDAFRLVAREVPGLQLVMAGSMARDDPEGMGYLDLTTEHAAGDPDIHLLTEAEGVGDSAVNAFQRAADVVIQKSMREGFGLVVAEGMWKGSPWSAATSAASALQIEDGVTGFLVDCSARAPSASSSCCAIPRCGRRMGEAGAASASATVPLPARDRGLPPADLAASRHEPTAHRRVEPRTGDVRARRRPDALVAPPRRRAGSSPRSRARCSRPRACGSPPRCPRATARWPPRARAAASIMRTVASATACATSTSRRTSTTATTTRSRTACCGSPTTTCGTRSRRRRSATDVERGVGRTTSRSTAGSRTPSPRRASDGRDTAFLVQDYHLALVPRLLRELRPGRPDRALLAHPVRRTDLPPDAARRDPRAAPARDARRRRARVPLAGVGGELPDLGPVAPGRAGRPRAVADRDRRAARCPCACTRSRSTARAMREAAATPEVREPAARARAVARRRPPASCGSTGSSSRRTSSAGSRPTSCSCSRTRRGWAACGSSRCSRPRGWSSPSTASTREECLAEAERINDELGDDGLDADRAAPEGRLRRGARRVRPLRRAVREPGDRRDEPRRDGGAAAEPAARASGALAQRRGVRAARPVRAAR